jgi:hypothetical protein
MRHVAERRVRGALRSLVGRSVSRRTVWMPPSLGPFAIEFTTAHVESEREGKSLAFARVIANCSPG